MCHKSNCCEPLKIRKNCLTTAILYTYTEIDNNVMVFRMYFKKLFV